MDQPKPFDIPKVLVWEAYQRVKANKGGSGVDHESLEEFDKKISKNLYKIWNRLSSGSYFPPAVRGVEIPNMQMMGYVTVKPKSKQKPYWWILQRGSKSASWKYIPRRQRLCIAEVVAKRKRTRAIQVSCF